MFTLQVGFMSPSFVGIVPSIEMVIFAAVGGRMSLIGVVYGTLLVNFGKSVFSETFPELWLFLMGALFIGVVMFFPNGLAGLWVKHGYKAIGCVKKLQCISAFKTMLENKRTAKLSTESVSGE
jgi:urea transport system permease protein